MVGTGDDNLAHAAMQCGRAMIPEVRPPVPFEEAVAEMAATDSFFCYEKGGEPFPEYLKGIKPEGVLSFFVGAEGGISDEEAGALKARGAVPVWLGNRILRCETCAPFVLACLAFSFEMKLFFRKDRKQDKHNQAERKPAAAGKQRCQTPTKAK